jgi:hypothetical protein
MKRIKNNYACLAAYSFSETSQRILTEFPIVDYADSCREYVLNNGPYLVNKTTKLL